MEFSFQIYLFITQHNSLADTMIGVRRLVTISGMNEVAFSWILRYLEQQQQNLLTKKYYEFHSVNKTNATNGKPVL